MICQWRVRMPHRRWSVVTKKSYLFLRFQNKINVASSGDRVVKSDLFAYPPGISEELF